jgi:hypothetical protein
MISGWVTRSICESGDEKIAQSRWRSRRKRDLKNQWFQASNDIKVAFSPRVAIGEFVLLTSMELLWVAHLDLVIGQTITHSALDLSQGSPLHERVGGELARCLHS